jgi:hypothetical protein
MDDKNIEKVLKQLDRIDDIIAKVRDQLESSLDEYENDSEFENDTDEDFDEDQDENDE